MSGLITGFINIFRFHKLKILTGVLAFFFFLLILFPFDDMSDWVTAQVARLTQNQIFLKFSNPGLSFFPTPGMKLHDVYVETPYAAPLKAETLSVSPSLSSLLAFKSGVSLSATDILGGDLSVSAYSSKMKESNAPSQKVTIDADNLDLLKIAEFTNLPVRLRGHFGLTSDGEFDLTWKEQPQVKLTMSGKKIQVPPDTVPTAMGPLPLPDLTFSTIEIEGELKGGQLRIEKGVLGNEKDDLNGTITGDVALQISNLGAGPVFTAGAYNLKLRLNVKESLEKKVALFLILCDKVKKKNGGIISYPCELSAPSANVPPTAKAL